MPRYWCRVSVAPRRRIGALEDVDVEIDQAGSDIEAGGVNDAAGVGRGDLLGYGGDFTAGYGDVPGTVNAGLGVDNVAVAEEEIVFGLGEGRGGDEEEDRETHTGDHIPAGVPGRTSALY